MMSVIVDLADPNKARDFIKWSKESNTKWDCPAHGYMTVVYFNNIFDLLRWI
jgi:hypothetical protein